MFGRIPTETKRYRSERRHSTGRKPMKTSIHGSIAVAALCAFLAACGGSSDSPPPPTVLPASVAIANDARAEAGAASTFKTDLATTTGLTFHWDFGDGSTGTGATASHAYAKPGTYQVT